MMWRIESLKTKAKLKGRRNNKNEENKTAKKKEKAISYLSILKSRKTQNIIKLAT